MRYATGDKRLIKEINRASILKLIRDKESISRAEIAKTLGLTSATISSGISDLMRQGIVREAGMGDSSGGRKPVLVELDKRQMFFVGVDIHKDGVKVAIVNINGKILYCDEYPLRGVDDDLKDQVNAAICQVREKSKIDADRLYGIGIGMHGVVDISRDITVFAPAMALRDVVVKPYVEQEQNLPVLIDNDANAMAVGELWFGHARNLRDFIFVSAGKGIGAGIMFNGQIYYGKSFTAGEIGHIRVSDNGRKCVCGRFGCLDTVAAERPLIQEVQEKIRSGADSVILDLLDGDLEHLDLNTIIRAAMLGDACAVAGLETVGRYLGIALSYVINILNPEGVILGGSLSQAGDIILQPLIRAAEDGSMAESVQDMTILCSATGENAGVIGAAAMVIQQYFEQVAKLP